MSEILITGTGLFTPPDSITNEELVESLSRANVKWNAEHKDEIESGAVEERDMPSVKFILKASGLLPLGDLPLHHSVGSTGWHCRLPETGEDG